MFKWINDVDQTRESANEKLFRCDLLPWIYDRSGIAYLCSWWLDASAEAIIEIKMWTFIPSSVWANLVCDNARSNKIGFVSAKKKEKKYTSLLYCRTFSAIAQNCDEKRCFELTHRWFICVFDSSSTRNAYLRSQYPTNWKESLVSSNFFQKLRKSSSEDIKR